MNYKTILGEKIKNFRRVRGLTQEDLAKCVNRSKNHISKIEQGTANPPLSLLLEIAQALEIDPTELLGDSQNTFSEALEINLNQELFKIKNSLNRQIILDTIKILIEKYS